MDNGLVIDVKDLKKSFGDVDAVKGVSLTARRGEIFGFLGPNGSGKTTTIRMICGLLTPDAGEGTCLGYDVLTQQGEIKKNTGYMSQRFSLYEDLSTRENLDFIARIHGIGDRKKAVREMMDEMGLADKARQLAGELSGGWKQRLALAACLMHRPRLLLLDEPTAGIDPEARRGFWDQINRLSAEGVTTLVSTHYMDEAERCHKLAYIAAGRLLTEGSAGRIIEESGLFTWQIMGPELWRLSAALAKLPGVDLVAAFGNVLHASGRDAAALRSSLAPYMADPAYEFRETEPQLEDVFISLMRKTGQVNI